MSRIRSTGRGSHGAGLRSSYAGPDDPYIKLLASDAQTYSGIKKKPQKALS